MMTSRTRLNLLLSTAALLLIVLAVFLANLDATKTQQRPEELRPAAEWLTRHPADWVAASIISDAALDSPLPNRFALWRAAYQVASRLAPRRHNASAAFVRAGLFHWYELAEPDRRAVLNAAMPLLRDPNIFPAMHAALFELTHDIGLLRRANPGTRSALTLLSDLAAKNGKFDDYRALREELRRRSLAEFNERRASAPYGELMMLLPDPISTADEPLVRALLAELHRRPIESMADAGRTRALIVYALRHHLPLDGLHPFTRIRDVPDWLRARLALHLGDIELASQIELASWVPGSKDWVPYHLDRALMEARRGDGPGAQVYLDRAVTGGLTPAFTAESLEVVRLLGGPDSAGTAAVTAIAPAEIGGFVHWQDEVFTPRAMTLSLPIAVVQSDQIPPYVEVYVDDVLAAEGPVDVRREFALPVAGVGLHQLEVRIANPVTRGRVQRRIRISE